MKVSRFSRLVAWIMLLGCCYLYFASMSTLFNMGYDFLGLDSKRTLLFIVEISLCLVATVFSGQVRGNGLLLSSGLLTCYMFIVGLFQRLEPNVFSWLSCSVIWYLFLLFTYELNVNDHFLNSVSYFCCIHCILISFLYFRGIQNRAFYALSVGNTNSIYYVLLAIPFSLMCPNPLLRITALLAATMTILFSLKGTCVLAVGCIWLFLFYIFLKKNKYQSWKLLLCIIGGIIEFIFLTLFVRNYGAAKSVFKIISLVIEEAKSGGNGRIDIYLLVLKSFTNGTFIQQLLGRGYAAVGESIGIGSHNDFLMVLHDYGIVGEILYLNFWVSLLQRLNRTWKQRSANISIAYTASLIIYFWISMASNTLNSQIQFLHLCVFWGFLLGSSKHHRKGRTAIYAQYYDCFGK